MIKVYLADDHLIIRDGLRALLEANPEISVVGDAPDGQKAVQEVLHLQPDVVIMDISMPILNGITATQEILAVLPEVRVIILSMLGDAEHVFRALEAGAQGYLLKESAGREVVEAVLEVFASKVYLSPPVTNTLIADYLHARTQIKPEDPFALLSLREREVLKLVVAGSTSAQIAEVLFLSPKTVESYRSRIMHKLGVPDIPSLIKLVLQHGSVD
ncbi:MAG: response regulator transcription factor [Anaerolineales bacterium]|jgi:DNA-binding NarL/FixJ family response regulator|nr:response regulator transcription factor [Anaerolineales bacterium]